MKDKQFTAKSNQVKVQNGYLKLFEEVRDYAIIVLDLDGNIQNWNLGAETIKGYKASEIIGRNFRQFYTDGDRKNGKPDRLLALAEQEGRVHDEGWRVRKDGSTFWGSITITAIHGEDGEVIGFGKVTRDLTDKKKVEDEREEQARLLRVKNDELRRSEMRFRHMIEEVEDYAILLMDKEGKILNWNKGVEHIKGYKADEIIGRNFRIFYPDEDRKSGKPDRLIGEAKKKGRAQDEGFRVRKDGNSFWGSITITAIHNDEGEVIGFSKVTRDLTERKAAEDAGKKYARKLEAKNSELEQFAYIASHDLQEPLHTIGSFVDLMKKKFGPELNEEIHQYMSFMSEASERMTALIKGLLEYSRLGSNRELADVDCNALLEAVTADLGSQIKENDAEVEIGRLPRLKGYPTELRMLFQNLLSNAIKFRKKDVAPKINVSAKKEDGGVKFAIRDNGIGIADSQKEKIFRIFHRLHPKSEYAGSGIGLAHCRKIVELHGGKMWVESKPNEGSTFYFTIA